MAGVAIQQSSDCNLEKEALVRRVFTGAPAWEGLGRSPYFNRELSLIETEPRQPVRAIVASFLFTDLVGFSKGTATEQYAAKAALSACLRNNLAALRETDYWIKDTGDGALIAFVSNPEHALYMALAIAEEYGHVSETGVPLAGLRTGLHLGTVKETIDIEARPNYIGDGINATKRVMDFADPGQIAASRNFFEAVANLDSEYAALFRHLGAPDDKHGRAHELYAIAPSTEVLNKLKLELAETAPRAAPPSAKGAPTIALKRDSPSLMSSPSRTPASQGAETARTGFKPVVALSILVALPLLAAAIYFTIKRPAPSASSMPPETTQAVVVPMPKNEPLTSASPPAVEAPAVPAPAPPASPPKLEEEAPAETAHAAPDRPAAAVVRPPVVAPIPAPKAHVDSTPRPSATAAAAATAAAPARVPATTDRESVRCSHIVEKAALGEPLSQEEKRELANSCR